MSADRLSQLEAVFSAAMELPPERRASFVAERCAGDPELRREVESLLGHASESIGMLDVPPVAAPIGATFNHEPARWDAALPADKRIGSYSVLRFLGAGGMGVVYLAEQERPRRTVALKVIRGSMASPSLIRRFEHEAEVLGRMHHPGIAQIYEAGVAKTLHGPQPYLAMELVEGPPLTDFAAARRLSTGERLELMARVCDAIHHAHQRGVIHRDLKPSNILVDAHGQPKILDFGVARAADADLQVTTLRTSVGQLIGTLPYMSPEQIAADPAEIDNRADVYALGVLTFELLAGRLPYDLRSRSIPEAARIIRDENPTRLSTVDRALRGDIETIVAKAMAKEKERRYQTAADLGEDIRRHLAGHPIAAREASAAEVLRRSLRRYRGAAAVGLILILSLTAVAIYASIQSTRNRALAMSEQAAREEEVRVRRQAEEQRRLAQELNEQLRQQLHAGLIERGRAEGVAQNGPGAESVLWPEWLADPDSRPARWALWELSARFPCLWTAVLEPGPSAVCASPDARLIAVGTLSGGVRVLLAESGEELGRIGVEPPSRSAAVLCMSFADSDTIVSVHADGRARRWRTRAGPFAQLDDVEIADGPISLATMAPDGSRFASMGRNRLLSVAIPDEHGRRWTLQTTSPIEAMAFDAPGRHLALGARDGSLSLWSFGEDEAPRVLGSQRELFRSLSFSPDASLLLASTHNGSVLRWSLAQEGSPHISLGASDARRVAFDARGERIFAARNLQLSVEQIDQEQRQAIGYPVNSFLDAAWVGERIVTIEAGGHVRLWESRQWPGVRTLATHDNWVFGVAFDPANERLASASGDGTVRISSLSDGRTLATATLPPRHRSRMALFNGDGSAVAAACSDGLVRIIDPATGAETAALGPVGAEIYGIAFSPDFTRLAAAAVNGTVTVFDLDARSVLRQASGLSAIARSVAYSPDGARLYTSGSPQGVLVWDAETLEQLDILRTTSEPWSVAISPDGGTVAAGTVGATVELFNLRTGARTTGAARHHLVVAGLAFSADGATLASGGDDGTIKLWEAASGRLLATLESSAGPIPGVAFSPDARALAGATAGGRAEIWDLHHHDRHIAGGLEAAIARFAPAEVPPENLQRLREWAARAAAMR